MKPHDKDIAITLLLISITFVFSIRHRANGVNHGGLVHHE